MFKNLNVKKKPDDLIEIVNGILVNADMVLRWIRFTKQKILFFNESFVPVNFAAVAMFTVAQRGHFFSVHSHDN